MRRDAFKTIDWEALDYRRTTIAIAIGWFESGSLFDAVAGVRRGGSQYREPGAAAIEMPRREGLRNRINGQLGHFALTGRLLPLLQNGNAPRVVSLSSVAARAGQINFDDLNATKAYKPMPAYSQSKLACLMFALEFQRRSNGNGWGSLASPHIPASPGPTSCTTHRVAGVPWAWPAACCGSCSSRPRKERFRRSSRRRRLMRRQVDTMVRMR